MAEIGLISSIIGVAGAGAQLALSLYTIADGIGSAGKEARMVAAETSLFSQSLTALSKCLEKRTSEESRLCEIAQVLVGSCRGVLDELTDLVDDLAPASVSARGRASSNVISGVWARTKWVLQKAKVAAVRSSIESFKTTLILLVASMDLTEATERSAPEEITLPLRVQVETLVEAAKDANNAFVECQEIMQHPDRQQNLLYHLGSGPDSSTQKPLLIDFSVEQHEAAAAAAADPSSRRETRLLLTNTSLDSQQLVLNLAQHVLHKARPQAYWSWDRTRRWSTEQHTHSDAMRSGEPPSFAETIATESTSATDTGLPMMSDGRPVPFALSELYQERISKLEDLVRSLQGTVENNASRSEDRTSQRIPKSEATSDTHFDDQNVPSTGMRDENASRRKGREQRNAERIKRRPEFTDRNSSSPNSATDLPEEELQRQPDTSLLSRARSADRKIDTANGNAGVIRAEDLRNMLQQALAGTDVSAGDIPDAFKPPIKFKDAVGRIFSFPWHLCKTWKGMEGLIKQAFLHVDVIGEHVHRGHYDLTGPDGEIILPQVWDQMVKPDWEVSMHMWPVPEPQPAEGNEKHMDDLTAPPTLPAKVPLVIAAEGRPAPPRRSRKSAQAPTSVPASSFTAPAWRPVSPSAPPPVRRDSEEGESEIDDGRSAASRLESQDGDERNPLSRRKWYRPTSWRK